MWVCALGSASKVRASVSVWVVVMFGFVIVFGLSVTVKATSSVSWSCKAFSGYKAL